MRETDAIRYGLLALHWGWVIVISNPADPIAHYTGYRAFIAIAPTRDWIIAATLMAILASSGFARRFFWLQEISLVVQALWLLGMSGLFASMLPMTTGTVAYGVFGFLASYAAIIRLQLRNREV